MKRCITTIYLFLFIAATTVASAQEQEVPKDITKNLRYYTGSWTVTGTLGNDPLKGKAQFRMPAGKHCIIGTVSFEAAGKMSHLSLVSGWDAATGWTTEMGAGSDGSIYTLKWRKVSDTVEEGKLTGTLGDKVMTEKDKIEIKSKDEFVVTCTERKIGDEAAPDLTLIYKRVAQPKKARAKDLPGPPTSVSIEKKK